MRRTTLLSIPALSAPQPAPAGCEPGAQAYTMGACKIIVGRSDARGWHLSISCANRYPTWDEVAEARYRLTPDGVTMAMLLPSRSEYVNVHNYCLHLWEVFGGRDGRVADRGVDAGVVVDSGVSGGNGVAAEAGSRTGGQA